MFLPTLRLRVSVTVINRVEWPRTDSWTYVVGYWTFSSHSRAGLFRFWDMWLF